MRKRHPFFSSHAQLRASWRGLFQPFSWYRIPIENDGCARGRDKMKKHGDEEARGETVEVDVEKKERNKPFFRLTEINLSFV